MKTKFLSVADGERLNIKSFPNFSKSGSIKGMKKMYYGEDALLIRCSSYIYYVGNLNAKSKRQTMTYGETLYFCHAK